MHPNFRFKFWERDVFIAGDIARNQERQTFFRFGLRDLMLLSTVVAETDERSMNRIKSTIGPTFDVFYFPHKEFLNFFFLYWKFVPFSGKGRFSFEQKQFQKESEVRPDKTFRNISLFRFLLFLRKDFVLGRTSENVVTSLISATWIHDLVNNNGIDDFKLGRNVRLHLQIWLGSEDSIKMAIRDLIFPN